MATITVRPAARSCARTARICSRRRHVEPGRRLVEQHDVALLGEALGDERPLALAARQLAEVAVGESAELDPLDGVVDGAAVLAAAAGATGPRTRRPSEGDDLADGHREVGGGVLGLQHVGDAPADLGRRRVRRR